MEKLKVWIKRPVNVNFIIYIMISIFMVMFAACSYKSLDKTAKLLDNLSFWLNNIFDEEIGEYGLLFGSIAHKIGKAGNTLLIVFQVYIPLYIAVVTTIQAIFTRVLYHPESSARILCYRISMAFCCITLIFHSLIFSYILMIYCSAAAMIIVDALFSAAIIICLRNSYSKRIKIQ